MTTSTPNALDLVTVFAGTTPVQYLRKQLESEHLRGTPLASLTASNSEIKLSCPPQIFLDYISPFIRYDRRPDWKELKLSPAKQEEINAILVQAGFPQTCSTSNSVDKEWVANPNEQNIGRIATQLDGYDYLPITINAGGAVETVALSVLQASHAAPVRIDASNLDAQVLYLDCDPDIFREFLLPYLVDKEAPNWTESALSPAHHKRLRTTLSRLGLGALNPQLPEHTQPTQSQAIKKKLPNHGKLDPPKIPKFRFLGAASQIMPCGTN